MGKRLIIKGADFSENGMASVHFMNTICLPARDNTGTFKVVGQGTAVSSFDRRGTIEVVAILSKNDTLFTVVAGEISTGAKRLEIMNAYTSGSTGVYPYNLGIAWGAGAGNYSKDIDSAKEVVMSIGSSVLVDGETLTPTSQPFFESDIFNNIRIYGAGASSVKYKRITFKGSNGEVIANYLPALNGEKVALYDTVSETYIYPNDGADWIAE